MGLSFLVNPPDVLELKLLEYFEIHLDGCKALVCEAGLVCHPQDFEQAIFSLQIIYFKKTNEMEMLLYHIT